MSTFLSKSGKVITLRPPKLGDESLLFHFARELEAEDTFVLLNPALPLTMSEETEYLQSCLKKINANWQVYFLAFHNDMLIGSSQVTVGGRRKMHVGQFGISINRQFRGDGIGFLLSQFVINQAVQKMELTVITLEVFANNLTALSLYQKLGFMPYGRLPGGLSYRHGYVDAIYMSKKV